MQQTAVPIPEQVSGAAQAVAEVPRALEPEEESPMAVANSFEAQAMRAEIIRVGRKLWERQYVDGNGGNISARSARATCSARPHAEQGRPGAV